MKHRFVGSISAIAVLVVALAGNAFAQQFATLRVTATDVTGAAIPGATVTLKSTQTGAKRTAVTGDTGLAVLTGVPAGPYELTVVGKDFKPRTVPVQLSVGQVASLGVQLGLEVRQQQVEVQETAQGIDLEKPDVSQVIEARKISDLPISGRDFIDFVLLTPSVNVGRSTAVGAQSPFTETVLKLSFGGTRESHTSFFALDGIDYGTSISGVQRVSPSQDWVQEFRVVESPYNADTGRNLGSVVNTITKSGTNDLHGSVYEFFRNSALDAKNVLSGPGFTALRFNQFGATLGGPLRKEKNFFFIGYEGQRRAESPIYSSFILNLIDSPPGCPINTVGVAPVFPCISINATKRFFGLQPEVLGSVLSVDNYDKFFAKVDNVLSDHTFLNIGYLFNDTRKSDVRGAAPGEGLPSSYRDNPVRDQTVYANFVHIFSPRLTSQGVLQFGRRTFNLEPKGAGLEPAINIPNALSGGGFVGSVRFYREQRVQMAENFTYVHGNHTFRFGGEIQPVWTNAQVPLFSPGFGVFCPDSFFGTPNIFGCGNFSSGPTELVFLYLEPRQFFGQPIAPRTLPFTTGLFNGPDGAAFDQSTRFSYIHKLYSAYAQDQWKARPNLTFTFGVHYDVDVLPSGPDTKTVGNFHPTQYNNVQPRAAFAYSFRGGKDVLRGGFGIFTAPFVYSDIMVSWIGASEFNYMFSSNAGPFGPPLIKEFRDPTHDLIGFGASGAVGLPAGILPGPSAFFNFATTGTYPTPFGPLVPFPLFPLEFPLGYAKKDFPNAYSEQASLELEHQLGKSWFFTAGYQFLHALKLPVYDSVNGLPNGRDPITGLPLPCAPTGSVVPTPAGKETFCQADPRFGFVLYVNPSGFSIYHAGTASLRKNFSNHYSILANYTWSKSIDIETTINLPNSPENYLNHRLDRAVGDNDIRNRFILAVLGESPKEWPRVLRNFKSSILLDAQSARFFTINTGFDTNGDLFPFNDRVGNIGRNTYKGDPYFNMDMRIQRVFPIGERVKGEFSAELFNVFNNVNVLDVNHVYGAPDFVGPVPKQFGDGITTPAGFGTPKFVAPARQVQFSIRFNF